MIDEIDLICYFLYLKIEIKTLLIRNIKIKKDMILLFI